jgi:hypothetical protein
MGGTDTNGTAPIDEFSPREAATLLDETQRQARRQFSASTPLLSLLRAVVVLIAYGAIWLSVRGQHPYTGPHGAVLVLVYAVVVLVIVASARVADRAHQGVSGRSLLTRRGVVVALAVAYVAAYVFMGALYHDGASAAIIYGVFPATAPLIVAGGAAAGAYAAREDWLSLAVSLAIVAVAAGSAFAGPVAVWAATGVGCAIALVGHAAALMWVRRA